MGNYLLDTCVYVGLINVNDDHHSVCKSFFLNHKDDNFFCSLHSFFEAKAYLAKEKRKGKFVPFDPVGWNLQGRKH
jgi:PIN domain nuclease of toxin-antitoxin system